MGDKEEIAKLHEIYDELWNDARTLISDMNQSIKMYLTSAILAVLFAFLPLFFSKDFIELLLVGKITFASIVGTLYGIAGFFILVGISFSWIKEYKSLKKKYAKLLKLEGQIED